MKEKSAYIHIPFCEHLCYYCDFNKVFLKGQPVDEYIQLLLKEMELQLAATPIENVPTIYIGGGTPTSLNATQLETLLSGVREKLPFAHGEFTLEANPGDLTEEKIALLKTYGVNRVSLGVQTFDDNLLKKIGRKHTAKQVFETLKLLDKKGMENVSIDLIYALPTQTLEDFRETLKVAMDLDLPHYSLYSLILENKTQFMNWVRKGKLSLPSDDEAADMFEETVFRLKNKNIHQYEISNFAKKGFESQHNLVYWNNEEYFGFGAGASGYVEGIRYKNFGPIQHYLAPLREGVLPVLEQETLGKREKMEEEMFLGLRKRSGVSKSRFKEKFNVSMDEVFPLSLEKLMQQDLIEEVNDFIRIKEKGLFTANAIFEQFLIDESSRGEKE